MSVTTYYGRLTKEQLEAMASHPHGLSQFVDGTIPKDQMLYLDKAAPVIAWLLSPLKRHEQLHFAAVVNARDDIANFQKPDFGPEPPFDEILIPIEGRGETKEERLDVGMGPTCIIAPIDVKRFSQHLKSVSEATLRAQLDYKAMDEAALSVDYWQEEGDQNFNDYILPLFKQLQAFYGEAASKEQHVLVWYN